MRKVGLSFIVTGFIGQLSALVWVYTSPDLSCSNTSYTPTPSQQQANLEQFPANSLEPSDTWPKEELLEKLLSSPDESRASLDSATVNPIQLPTATSEGISNYIPAFPQLSFSNIAIIVGGLVALVGLLFTFFSRKKISATQWHIFLSKTQSLLTLEDSCLTCGGVVRHTKNTVKPIPPHGLWIIEITLNTSSLRRSLKAIQYLKLPVLRKENNFIVIGPYRQKQDAALVLKDLSENHGVRGWIMIGN